MVVRELALTKLLENYKKQGGFGFYPIDTLMGTDITKNNIAAMIQQEDTIISLHNSTYDSPITRNILENLYLGRKCVTIDHRIGLKINQYGLPINFGLNRHGIDIVSQFLKYNTIRGYRNRLYWNEYELEKKRFIIENNEYNDDDNLPQITLIRTSSHSNLQNI
jgi:hypothetical protein